MGYGRTFAAGDYKLTDITKDADKRLIIFHADVEKIITLLRDELFLS